ncbi:MAG TPA: hypothetical protein VMF89_24950 [Polyangiales bacterium]|nr:hypothetical protein [Polyangiales bacterium]
MSPYAQPALYWIAALIGLVLALLTEGIGDAIALVLLCLPLLAIGRHVLRRS